MAKYHGEIASADISGADSFPAIAKQIIEDGGYSYEQIYNCDETDFYWKKSPITTYMHKTEKQAKGTKHAGDIFSVLFICKASGSLKLNLFEDENESTTLEPSATPGPSSATRRPSSTPAHILTVKQFWKKFNIHNAVDTMVDSWHEINVPTITRAWTPLFPHLKVKCGGASGAQQLNNGSLLAETVESVRRVGGEFAEDTIMNLVTFNSEENITKMLENDSDSNSDEEGQPGAIEKLTIAKLAKILAECSDMKESLQKFTQDAPEQQNALPRLDSLNDILMAIYNCKIREKQQSVITRSFRRRQDVADAIQNIRVADGAENAATTDVEPLENDLDFEGFLDKDSAYFQGVSDCEC
ncbi:Tigger transposable element-derived protein 1-like 117, partial [Homarus americanus]